MVRLHSHLSNGLLTVSKAWSSSLMLHCSLSHSLKTCSLALRASSCCLRASSCCFKTKSCCQKNCSASQHSSCFCNIAIFFLLNSGSFQLVFKSWIASVISLSFSFLRFVDELIVEEDLLLLSMKTSSGKSATKVPFKSGFESKCRCR